MAEIIVMLPKDRTQEGSVKLVNAKGTQVAGPFKAFGLADRTLAKLKGNPGCDRLKRYGDTPCGTFAIVDVVKTGEGSELAEQIYGREGAIRLKPLEGEAALAEQSGRTGFMIHGGAEADSNKIKPTSGSIRIADRDLRLLLEAIALLAITEGTPLVCRIETSSELSSGSNLIVAADSVTDPPPGMAAGWHLEGALRSAPKAATFEYPQGREGHDRDAHDRDAHDRDAHDRDAHDREAHDREVNREPAGHDRDPANHDRDAAGHDRG